MKRFNIYPSKTQEDKIVYGDGIVEGIVLLAISEIPYAELCSNVSYVKNKSKAIKIDFTNSGVMVEVKVKIDFSQSVTDMAFKIQEAIRHNIESMTDYHVSCVNVIVNDVLFTEQDKIIATQESSESPTENAEKDKEKEEKKN